MDAERPVKVGDWVRVVKPVAENRQWHGHWGKVFSVTGMADWPIAVEFQPDAIRVIGNLEWDTFYDYELVRFDPGEEELAIWMVLELSR